ncbi:DUF2946 family protein [Rubinisphaera italica]|uniref:DUF2946 domain-containing protein n=1 Tax=Rubinisphaera italica TaxID=2527969 RepID=A0A5C5XPT5_9PLAN|nr:DUF2946 family protein [Rubinisphaera italica]TWT63762.1 hypothetical protein Pan54_45200 [Rubinisphaera italica]
MRQQFVLSGILAAYIFGGLIYPYAHIHTHSCSHHHGSQQSTEIHHESHSHCHHVHSSTEKHQDSHQHSHDHSHSECPACELLWMAQFTPDLPVIIENYSVVWLESPAPAMVAINTDASLPLLRGPPVLA